jgi:phosphoglycolate phosphatase
MARAVLIDLDGTLIDTVPDIHAAIAVMCRRFDVEPPSPEAVCGWIGKGSAHLVNQVMQHQSQGAPWDAKSALEAYLAAYAELNGTNARVYPGVVDGLLAFEKNGVSIACVTNKPQELALALVTRMGLRDHFDVVVGGGQALALKPAPDLLLAAAGRMNAALDEVLMVGDSENDLAAARSAGCRCVLVDYGYSPKVPVRTLGADAIVATLVEASGWMHATLN